MEIVSVVPSFSSTFDTLVEAALAKSSPTMVLASSQDKASVSQATSPLSPIIQLFLRRDLEPILSPTLPAALWSKTFTFHGTLPTSSHIQPLLRMLESSSPVPLPLISFGDTATNEVALVNDIATENISAGHSSNTSWLEWESSFIAFKAFFDGGVQVLRSADELLPLCHRFNGYATFRGALVYPETVAALEKFMDKYGDFMDLTGITSSSRGAPLSVPLAWYFMEWIPCNCWILQIIDSFAGGMWSRSHDLGLSSGVPPELDERSSACRI
ncbi:hypothetical protein Pyn_11372 [Prunus yedoensis var. nudiflora]|uniref:Uncharacterized protein n=1 Tax=Prunus yedoensis var. nudiflora TaxID=2094558 RepID=A0A314ZQ31_PRUYE|nr:hypothetical protein Pyn_11372 [Prunus yedoensis var. nudiflora]